MRYLNRKTVSTPYGDRYISIYVHDVADLDEPIDIMTISAFYQDYLPLPGTMIGALERIGLSVEKLAQSPEIDLRKLCNVWLSNEITDRSIPIGRIGCIELSSEHMNHTDVKEHGSNIVSSIQAYFHMLEIVSLSGIKLETIGFPILGAGNQRIDMDLVTVPLLNECFSFLKINSQVQEIKVITRNPEKAYKFALALDNSYTMLQETIAIQYNKLRNREIQVDYRVFISYASEDKNIADNLCAKLEANGIKVWYAPRNIISDDYASAIVDAITHSSHFVVILSKNSLQSNHVLNEIDLAFQEIGRNIHFCPLKIDEEELGPAFRYYLSRQHWMDAHVPPLEKRLDEFVKSILQG